MDVDKKVSRAVINRLPRYYRYLGQLLTNDVKKTSSKELSRLMSITASQIRQDLNNFGCFGQQGYGYDVESLYVEIERILGINNTHTMIVIGCGNLGHALANYEKFELIGFKIVGMFDKNPDLIGKVINNMVIKDVDLLHDFLEERDVDVAVLAVPKENAEDVAEVLLRNKIRGIWNFANVELNVGSSGIIVENTQITDSLLTLTYKIQDRTL